ncbi:MAG: DNA repair protein RecO [Planctomycetaceae bacterium]|nr:DNA repair protein RecO [Planctomycetaceae bacterium]
MEKAEGFVIRQVDFSESSKILTLFTREYGKISAMAKGAKRLRGSFEAALDLLTICNIVFIRKSSGALDLLTEAKLIQRFKAGEKSLENLYAGYYVAELLASLTEEYDPHPQLYAEALSALERFSQGDQLERAVLRFELMLLQEIGHLPALEGCLVCDQPIEPDMSYAFRAVQGGLICLECLRQEPARRIHAGTISVIGKMLSENESDWLRMSISPGQLQEARSIVNSSLSSLMGKRPKMLSYLKFGHS